MRHICILITLLAVLLPNLATGADYPQRRRLLVLDSYHPGYAWSDSILEGLYDSLDSTKNELNLYLEYMDTKHHHSDAYFEKLRALYHLKYNDLHFDLIAACDDNAVKFLLRYQEELFPETPVFFCGINDSQTLSLATQMGMKGIFEQWRDKENIDLALELFPQTTTIAVIADRTSTGKGGVRRIQRLQPGFADRVDFVYVATHSIEQIEQSLAELPENTVILFTVLFRTDDEHWFSYKRGTEVVAAMTDKPIFVISDFSVVPGVIGGHVVSGYHQGEALGDMIKETILENRPETHFKRTTSLDTKLFDYQGLRRFGIPSSRLPEGSVIINKPFSFYDAYTIWIWLTVLFISLETLLIVLFALNRRHLKKAQHEVEQTNERLDLAIRGTEQALFYWDVPRNIVVFKYFWKDILGYDRELPHPTITEWHHEHIHPEDGQGVEAARMEHLQGKTPYYEQEFRARKADGSWCWLIVRGKVIEKDRDGAPLQVTGTLRDITQRKGAEQKQQRLVAALEQSEEAIAICDTSGEILSINNAFAEFYHVDPDTIRSTPIWDIDGVFKTEPMWANLEQDKGWRKHIKRSLGEGQTCDLELKASPIKDDRGKTMCHIFSHRDITRETELESQLRQAQKMEAIGQLAGGIAHDFNNLLQVILGYTSKVFAELGMDADNRGRLEKITDASKKAANLVRQLLIFSRRDMVSRQAIDANDVIKEVLGLLKRTLGEQVVMEFSPEPSLPLIEADANQLHQIVMNLCVNARDAMPQGGTISISTARANLTPEFVSDHPWARHGSFVRIEVRDTGSGMPPEVREHIFEPFFTTKETGKGTGLGLATVYGIVKSHEGLIHVDSEPGKGTSFRIYLRTTEVREPERTPEAAPRCESPSCSATILMAEDDDMVRSLTMEVLEDAGYTILEAANGAEAVELFKANRDRIDLVLLDVIMPQMSGQQAWEKIHAIRPDLPVIFSSGYSFNELKENTLIAEKGRLIQKPYTPDRLMDVIAKTLASSPNR